MMEITISEDLQRKLITESLMGDLSKVLLNISQIGKENLKDTQKMMKFDLKFLLTWSATIGGFMGPLNQYIKDQNVEITEANINLIVVGVCATLFYNNEKLVAELVSKIKEKGLIPVFESALEKGAELRSALIRFLESIGLTVGNLFAIASFTFLIPIIGMLNGYATSGEITPETIQEISERIAMAGVTALSATTIRNFLKKFFAKSEKGQSEERHS
jgi:hypothetical protein